MSYSDCADYGASQHHSGCEATQELAPQLQKGLEPWST
jgi:hypothetical protein